ncbi:MAG: hypothetical protein KC944_14345 [Candidatus Omnitrophica bacterium]|nr:hypothetical protein [Candidatus Omnitrophota bacterium]
MREMFLRFTLLLIVGGLFSERGSAQSMTSRFTYQGQVEMSGSEVNENCDFQFTLWDDPTATASANRIGATVTLAQVEVIDGIFTVELDFGAGAFDGGARHLQISVACPSGEPYQTLSPRQEILPTPYAQLAVTAKSVHWSDIQDVPPGFADGVDNSGSDGSDHVHSSLDAPDGDPVEAVKVGNNGSVEFGSQDAFGAEVTDQSSVGGTTSITGDGRWQTFTAGIDGRVTSITLPIQTGSQLIHLATLILYEGQGTGGAVLGVTARSLGQNQSGDVIFGFATPPNVVAGNVYTWTLTGTTDLNFFRSETNPYAGGAAETGGDHDYNFSTRVEPAIEIPTMTLTEAGDLGIGTQTPTGRLHVSASSGNGSVVLPTSSISSVELGNEPGVVQATMEGPFAFDSRFTFVSASITAPSSGFVWATATGTATIYNVGGSGINGGNFGLENADSMGYPLLIVVESPNSGYHSATLSVTGIFPVTEGTHTFALNRRNIYGSGNYNLEDVRMDLLFVPTAYGNVSSPEPFPPKTIETESGE